MQNNGSNIHLCFTCNKMVCDKHNPNPVERINIDMLNPQSVPVPINVRVNDDGDPGSTQNENSDSSGFPDQRRSSITDRSPFFPTDRSTSPFHDSPPPSAPPPTCSSGYNPMIRPYATSPTNAFEHQPGQPTQNTYTADGSNLSSHNNYNLDQNSEDAFQDLPPSYEVAMMDETDVY